ncbi:MAG: nucleoside-diphosphate sugar epimerase/dehydratase, partial [Pseudomonadota bacterium]
IKSGAKYRTVPNISDLVDGIVKVKELREVRLEDLLKRDEVQIDKKKVGSYITGKTVLVTGAGGSIGSELCRQVAKLCPKKLVLFEKAENPLFYIDNELGQFTEKFDKIPIIGDICDRKRVREVFNKYQPDIIFHAAAHKHVPLMENNSMEAIKNNVFGTKIISEEAINFHVDRFIMLSTDKAVNPTSLMGVSKKIAEMYVEAVARVNGTKFMAVRFGNVLGSEGSVVPTFKKQIERGGPVEITHPEIKRYFMTIPEAAGLVLEAGYRGRGGEIFILEMGQQIKIYDLAKDVIRLSGKIIGKDIEIVYTGLRPGEKMYEELFTDDEVLINTSHDKIMVLEPNNETTENMFNNIKEMEAIVSSGNMISLLEKIKEMVPTYTPGDALQKMIRKHNIQNKLDSLHSEPVADNVINISP